MLLLHHRNNVGTQEALKKKKDVNNFIGLIHLYKMLYLWSFLFPYYTSKAMWGCCDR